ncbi:MAG: gliding motility-associated C-terminal domain-containing protein [Bacteroidia bacterium]
MKCLLVKLLELINVCKGNIPFKNAGLLYIAFLFSFNLAAQEICNNGLDDDNDGLIDLNDNLDCTCNGITTVIPGNSLLPNPSFEDYNCLPSNFSQFSCVNSWHLGTPTSSDFFVNQTGAFWPEFPTPLPDGQAVAGFFSINNADVIGFNGEILDGIYNEYLGTCLPQPMEAGTEYALQMSLAGIGLSSFGTSLSNIWFGPIDITIYGSASCPQWPVSADTVSMYAGCPTVFDDWVELGHVTYQADGTWQIISIEFTPSTTIQAIIIGGPCTPPDDYTFTESNGVTFEPYFVMDNVALAEVLQQASIESMGSICADNLTLLGSSDTLTGNYQWYFNGIALAGQTSLQLSWSSLNLEPGNYQFVVNPADSVCAVAEQVVTAPGGVEPLISVSVTSGCEPLTVEFENITPTPTPSILCTWNFGDGTSAQDCATMHEFAESGIYSIGLSITLADGCTYDTTYQQYIEVTSRPFLHLGNDTVLCEGQSIELRAQQSGLWNTGDTSDVIQITEAGSYWVEITQGACVVTDSIQIEQLQLPAVSLGDDLVLCAGDKHQLVATTAFAEYYHWSTGDSTESVLLDASAELSIKVGNVCGTSVDSVNVLFEDCSAVIFIPNCFTPNEDGMNDFFRPTISNVTDYYLMIFDRWGGLIFQSKDPAEAWHSGSQINQPDYIQDGVYNYLLICQTMAGNSLVRRGCIYVIR